MQKLDQEIRDICDIHFDGYYFDDADDRDAFIYKPEKEPIELENYLKEKYNAKKIRYSAKFTEMGTSDGLYLEYLKNNDWLMIHINNDLMDIFKAIDEKVNEDIKQLLDECSRFTCDYIDDN